jgi:hypothetical protein
MNKIRIISDGTPFGTKVIACKRQNGIDIELHSVTGIEFSPISCEDPIPSVKITFAMPEIDVMADLDEAKNG